MRNLSLQKLVIILALLVSLASLVGCSGGGAESKITLSALSIAPSQLTPGQTVTIAVNVLNSGKQTEQYSAVLKINNAEIETQKLTVAAGATQTVNFQYVPNALGPFQVDINGQTGSFAVVKPAAFSVGPVILSPQSPAPGSDITASAKVQNSGDASGDYTAVLKVDGNDVKSNKLTVNGGGSQDVTFVFSVDKAGTHTVEIGGSKQEIKLLKPADFKGSAVTITPGSVLAGEQITIEATVTNQGDARDTRDVALMLNGSQSGSQSVTLDGGLSGKVVYSFTPQTSGDYKVDVLGATGSFSVVALSKYSSKSYYYTLSYPPDFSINEKDPKAVSIQNDKQEGLNILLTRQSTTTTARDYLDFDTKIFKTQSAGWALISQSEVVESGATIGYKFDYSDIKSGNKWLGKGLAVIKAGLGYTVTFQTAETDWSKYQASAAKCLDGFISPASYSGSYSNASLGVALTLPAQWSVTETGSSSQPLFFSPPYDKGDLTAPVGLESVPAGTTAKQYSDTVLQQFVARNWVLGTGADFNFADGTVGYARPMSGTTGSGITYIYRTYSVIKNGRAVFLIFFGTSGNIDPQMDSINQLARSLVISKAGGVSGVDRNDAVFLPAGEIPTLDPALVETGPGDIIGAIFSGLVRLDSNLQIAPDLAESWKVSADGKTYTFSLRKNAKFQDGRPVTAADVKYSWERACDPLLKSPKAKSFLADIAGAKERLAGTAATISGIKVVDDQTLEVTLDSAKAYFLGELCQPVAFVVDKNDIARGSNWYEKPNGTGAFKLKTWQKDNLLVLERNDSFYLAPAKVKNLVFKLYAGNTMQLYENGEIDIAPVSTQNLDKVLDSANPLNKEVVSGAAYNIDYIGLNVTQAPLDDPNIRQALALALDVPKLIDVSLKGRAQRAAGYIPPGIPGNNPGLQPFSFDLEKAKQLIKQSKYQSADKVPAITLYTPYGVTPVEQAIIGMWQNLGLKVNTQVISTIDEYLARSHKKELQVWVGDWRADYIDPQNFLEILFQSQAVDNGFAYNNPAVDAALARAAVEQDPAARIKLYQDIEKMVLADLPGIPLWDKSMSYVLVKPYIKGYVVYPVDINIWRDLSVTPH